jgi:hypothetical protein
MEKFNKAKSLAEYSVKSRRNLRMNINKWTLGLVAAGVVSLGSVAQAEEASEHLMTAVSGTQISGYISTSASWWAGTGSIPGGLPGRSFTDGPAKQDGFNLDVIDLTVSKSLDESEWAAGYKAELWFGPDAAAYGSSSTGVNASDFNIRQAYVELRAPVGNGIDFKVGVFDTIIGYEVSNHDGNPNHGRSYGYFLEPTSHTGILASYAVTDFLSFSAGVANNANLIAGANTIGGGAAPLAGKQIVESDKSYMFGSYLTAPESWGFLSGATLSAGVVEQTISSVTGGGNKSDAHNYYVGLALPLPIEGWSIGAAWDYRGQGQDSVTQGTYANAYALYLSAAVSEKMTVNLRADYTSAASTRVGNAATYYATGAGHNNQLGSLTTTLDYSLWENVISRVEVRWDHQLSGGVADANGGFDGGVFGGGAGAIGNADKNAVTVALNLIYKF